MDLRRLPLIGPNRISSISIGSAAIVIRDRLVLMLFFYRSKIVGNGTPESSDEITEVKWFDLDAVPENSFENVKPVMEYLKNNPE